MGLQNISDWTFLRQSNLQELRLVDDWVSEENEWMRQVMANVPNSIEKLYLKGAFPWRGQEELNSVMELMPLKSECFAQLNPQLVTHLSIFNAGGLVDNQLAQFICKNFKMLRKFNLSGAQTDDEGFLEIAGLKGLQVLTLNSCGVSDQTLKLIRFLELRYLDISGNVKTTLSGIKMAMENCPSLETLYIPNLKSDFTQDDAQKICPRLKFLSQPCQWPPLHFEELAV